MKSLPPLLLLPLSCTTPPPPTPSPLPVALTTPQPQLPSPIALSFHLPDGRSIWIQQHLQLWSELDSPISWSVSISDVTGATLRSTLIRPSLWPYTSRDHQPRDHQRHAILTELTAPSTSPARRELLLAEVLSWCPR
jgi:hypothetical protein